MALLGASAINRTLVSDTVLTWTHAPLGGLALLVAGCIIAPSRTAVQEGAVSFLGNYSSIM